MRRQRHPDHYQQTLRDSKQFLCLPPHMPQTGFMAHDIAYAPARNTVHQLQLTFPEHDFATQLAAFAEPDGYRGLYAFHKYWGKKPAEPIRYLIQHLARPGGLVVDPFLGSGISALEAVQLRRRIIGVDINPAAVRIARLLVSPPPAGALRTAFQEIASRVRETILNSYLTAGGKSATHFVWQGQTLKKVWVAPDEGRMRVETPPSEHDLLLLQRFDPYQPSRIRNPRFFKNSRINSSPDLTLKDLFTGRALCNIELLLDAIGELPTDTQEAFRLSLTAAIGQMSKMVFAVTSRGKTSGRQPGRMEVGSWVVGYWRPELHFEVNVWNCFERRAQKLIDAVNESTSARISAQAGDVSSVCEGTADYSLVTGDTLKVLPLLPDDSIDLVITDPPHSDRIPYLELSELWNAVLGECPPLESEIVVSNAKVRLKTKFQYNESMMRFLEIVARKLRDGGFLVLFFNARTKDSWKFFKSFSATADGAGIAYCGCFPLVYSASSVVQDNRDGALRTDFGSVFARSVTAGRCLADIPGWASTNPTPPS